MLTVRIFSIKYMNNEKKLLICSNVTLNPIDIIINEKEKIFDIEIGDFDNIWIKQ